MRKTIDSLMVFVLVVSLIPACGLVPRNEARDLDRLSIGMPKQDVKKELGPPDNIRAVYKDENDKAVEIWEYNYRKISPGQAVGNPFMGIFWTITWWAPLFKDDRDYSIYFKEETLAKWNISDDRLIEDPRVRIKQEK